MFDSGAVKKLPELLCPAGSREALEAAIEGGADAVYLGGTAMNARIHAGNFSPEQLREAVKLCHTFGVKVYLTLNTLVTDREIPAFLDAARDASDAGVDALIVADAGGAAAIHRILPTLELHASTQMSGHNSEMGKELQKLGFARMVAAREISMENLRKLVASSPIETELFIHGALCVCHSGQCLFSSLVGGRSGNRGECAQPCRLPYACTTCKHGEAYPLSLKDLTLARHVTELIDIGVSSLKIEGRMKSPEYVRDTARMWRKLLDERRNATPEEVRQMAQTFSRGGFTDGYWTQKIDSSMLGVRSESDKDTSRRLEPFGGLQRKIPLSMEVAVQAEKPILLTLSDGKETVTVTGDLPQVARTAPMTKEDVIRSLSKFGGTPYVLKDAAATVEEGLMIPVSRLNELRRRAVEKLDCTHAVPMRELSPFHPAKPTEKRTKCRTARFRDVSQITKSARKAFGECYLPLERYHSIADGVVMPPVIFDGDFDRVRKLLADAKAQGAKKAIVGNLGHLSLVIEAGLIPVGDYRLNITNTESAGLWESLGISSSVLSPELTLPQIRDLGGNTSAVVYGRIPLMTLEKCVIREIASCEICAKGNAKLRDRKGVEFPVLREWEHRNVVYNSLPTAMSDKADALVRYRVENQHFFFTTETPREVDAVIEAYQNARPIAGNVRRINP